MNTANNCLAIKQFIDRIRSEYPNISIDYEYDSNEDEYCIYHDDYELEFNDNDFMKFVSKTAEEILFDNGIYNFCFCYNCCRTSK